MQDTMSKKRKDQVSAIIPAYNEEKNILGVLRALVASPVLGEIIVVDDGSTDDTVLVVKENFPQVKCILMKKNVGKADALLAGAHVAKNPILFFCDADLTDLKAFQVMDLVAPVVEGRVGMVVGVQERMDAWRDTSLYRKLFPSSKNSSEESSQMSDFVKGLGGEKVMLQKDFLAIPGIAGSDYGVEHRIINYFKEKKLPFEYYVLKGVGHVWKLQKWGIFKGLTREVRAFTTFGRQYLAKIFASTK